MWSRRRLPPFVVHSDEAQVRAPIWTHYIKIRLKENMGGVEANLQGYPRCGARKIAPIRWMARHAHLAFAAGDHTLLCNLFPGMMRIRYQHDIRQRCC
jgi:hypothetical protein